MEGWQAILNRYKPVILKRKLIFHSIGLPIEKGREVVREVSGTVKY